IYWHWLVCWSAKKTMSCSAKQSSRFVISFIDLAPGPIRHIWQEKKRLRRLRRHLSALHAKREVPGLPRQNSLKHVGACGLSAGLLLLRTLRQGRLALG